MKNFIIILIFLIYYPLSFGFEGQQGFVDVKENDAGFSATCEKQCFLVLGKLGNTDKLKINLDFIGSGKIGYGYLIGKQIIPGEILKINGKNKISYEFVLSENKYFSQIPKKSKIILIFDGKIKVDNLNYNLIENSFLDNIKLSWNDFWNIETLTPYSINLRYGVKILGVSILKYGYYIFFLFLIISLFVKKYRKIDVYISIALALYLFIGFRNLITYSNITKTGLETFTYAKYENKLFFDLGDYITFTDKILSKIDKNNCNIYMESFRDWPFKAHMVGFYLKPCNVVSDFGKSNYAIYYKKNYDKNINGSVLVDYKNSYLLELNK